ncbi:hypothetical protein F4815DRAFT_451187, partial [Daldinia loculata]
MMALYPILYDWFAAQSLIGVVLGITFDMAKLPGQQFDLERTLLHYGFLVKPELRVRFVPVAQTGDKI